MLSKTSKLHDKFCEHQLLVPLFFAVVISLGIQFSTVIPILLVFLYVSLFNKNYLFGLIITLPLYDAHFTSLPFSLSKMVFVIIIIVLVVDLRLKKIELRKNELFILLLIFMASIGAVVAIFNPQLIFIRDQVQNELLFETLPKLLFILLLFFTMKSNEKYIIKKQVINSARFVTFFIITLSINVLFLKEIFDFVRFSVFNVGPNFFAVFTLVLLPFVLYVFYTTENKKMIIVSLVALGAVAYILGTTSSRTGVLILIFGGILSLLMLSRLHKKRTYIIIGIGALGVLAIIFLPYFQNLLVRVTQQSQLSNLVGMLNGRYELYQSSFRLILQRILIGYGGSKDTAIILLHNDIGIPQVAHSIYLEVLLQYGVYGTIIYTFIYSNLLSNFTIITSKRFYQEYTWQIPVYISFFSLLVAGILLSINFRDIYIFLLAFVLVLPSIQKKGA